MHVQYFHTTHSTSYTQATATAQLTSWVEAFVYVDSCGVAGVRLSVESQQQVLCLTDTVTGQLASCVLYVHVYIHVYKNDNCTCTSIEDNVKSTLTTHVQCTGMWTVLACTCIYLMKEKVTECILMYINAHTHVHVHVQCNNNHYPLLNTQCKNFLCIHCTCTHVHFMYTKCIYLCMYPIVHRQYASQNAHHA